MIYVKKIRNIYYFSDVLINDKGKGIVYERKWNKYREELFIWAKPVHL